MADDALLNLRFVVLRIEGHQIIFDGHFVLGHLDATLYAIFVDLSQTQVDCKVERPFLRTNNFTVLVLLQSLHERGLVEERVGALRHSLVHQHTGL